LEHVESNSQDAQINSVNNSLDKTASEEISLIFTEEVVPNEEENKQDSKSNEQSKDNRFFIHINLNPEDSGSFSAENSKKESGSSESSGEFLLSEDVNNIEKSPILEVQKMTSFPENIDNIHVRSSHVCVKLCNLIKAQLGN
jgi:hypothetical protein